MGRCVLDSPQEIFGTLASGGSYRATPTMLEMRGPTGEVIASFDTRTFNSVSRADNVLTIGRLGGSNITITTSTGQEAEQLEAMLARSSSIPVSTPSNDNADPLKNPLFKWGCIGALALVGLGAVCLLALIFVFRDDNKDTPAVAASPVPSVTVAAQAPSTAAMLTPTAELNEADEATPAGTEPASTVVQTIAPTATEAVVATNTPEPTPTPEPEATLPPAGPGMSRANPLPFGELHATGDWDLQVIEVVRGQAALDMVMAENQFNEPPPEGYEYVLANLFARYTGTSSTPQAVDTFWLQSTGDANVLYQYVALVNPQPVFQANLLPGGEVTGWATLLAREGESNLIAIWEDWSDFEAEPIYLALEPGARIESPSGRLAEQNDLGTNVSDPVPFGEQAITETWEITVLEYVRGQQALDMVMEANQFNSQPDPGMEYVTIKVRTRNVGTAVDPAWITSFSFGITGNSNRIYDSVFVVEPDPALDYQVFPGGEVEGWFTVAVPVEEQNLILVYQDWLSFFEAPRYLALE